MALPASSRLPEWLLLVSLSGAEVSIEGREGAVRYPTAAEQAPAYRSQPPVRGWSFELPSFPAPWRAPLALYHHEGAGAPRPKSVCGCAIEAGHPVPWLDSDGTPFEC
jgi:hypothetical protein